MIGQHIQNYTITSHLGEGGMGSVYRASDTMLGRDVALKMLHATLTSQPQFLERFKKEARVLAQLLHPNIAVIYNFIGQHNNHFMVMEYVEGNNLDTLLRKHKQLSYKTIVPVFLQALEGLHHAHKKGIFHRDIKPSNLILTPEGMVKLMDFGIAKIAGEQRMTQVNRVVGTIEFMAPELIEGKDPSIASDIYATGVTMYELLTGKLPFENNTDYTLMQEILKKKPVSVEKLNTAVPKALSDIVMKALEKNPENRFKDAKTFQHALAVAFPMLRDIDLNEIGVTTAPETQIAQVITQPKGRLKPTELQSAVAGNITRPVSALQTLKQKVFSKEKRPLLVVTLSILLVATAGLTLLSRKGNGDELISNNQSLTQADSLYIKSEENKNNPAIEYANSNKDNTIMIPVSPGINEKIPPNNTENPKEEKNKAKEKEVNKNKTALREEDNNKNNNNVKPVPSEENWNITPVNNENDNKGNKDNKEETNNTSENRRTLKSIQLNSKLEVSLYLREPITAATAEAGQTLLFNVTNPVYYNGEMIIEKGAVATGRIRSITNKKISIVLSNVTSVGGQKIPFQSIELSGRLEEILAARNYSGTLQKGITVSYY
jgi:serine/threonine-protein kinase